MMRGRRLYLLNFKLASSMSFTPCSPHSSTLQPSNVPLAESNARTPHFLAWSLQPRKIGAADPAMLTASSPLHLHTAQVRSSVRMVRERPHTAHSRDKNHHRLLQGYHGFASRCCAVSEQAKGAKGLSVAYGLGQTLLCCLVICLDLTQAFHVTFTAST